MHLRCHDCQNTFANLEIPAGQRSSVTPCYLTPGDSLAADTVARFIGSAQAWIINWTTQK